MEALSKCVSKAHTALWTEVSHLHRRTARADDEERGGSARRLPNLDSAVCTRRGQTLRLPCSRLKSDAARDFDTLGVQEAAVVGQQCGDKQADVVRIAETAECGELSDVLS